MTERTSKNERKKAVFIRETMKEGKREKERREE